MVSYRNPSGRLVLLTIYYLAIILALVLMYGEGQSTSTDFIYQGF